jgi:hypothetical protein
MSRTISIEDMVLPLRTYSWAVTGSVSLADALLVKCFDKLSKARFESTDNKDRMVSLY